MTLEDEDVIIYNDTRWCYYKQIDSYSWCPDPDYATVPSTNTGKEGVKSFLTSTKDQLIKIDVVI